MPRVTQRIPRSQRRRTAVELTLHPHARDVLQELPPRRRSQYVSELLLRDAGELAVELGWVRDAEDPA